jgi:hypothetical protein
MVERQSLQLIIDVSLHHIDYDSIFHQLLSTKEVPNFDSYIWQQSRDEVDLENKMI